jgi:hypothetical protein
MLFDPTRPVLSLLVLAFCITILWAAITATMTLQRIATSIELLVRQKEKLGANWKIKRRFAQTMPRQRIPHANESWESSSTPVRVEQLTDNATLKALADSGSIRSVGTLTIFEAVLPNPKNH